MRQITVQIRRQITVQIIYLSQHVKGQYVKGPNVRRYAIKQNSLTNIVTYSLNSMLRFILLGISGRGLPTRQLPMHPYETSYVQSQNSEFLVKCNRPFLQRETHTIRAFLTCRIQSVKVTHWFRFQLYVFHVSLFLIYSLSYHSVSLSLSRSCFCCGNIGFGFLVI